jgi:hypothetical protein
LKFSFKKSTPKNLVQLRRAKKRLNAHPSLRIKVTDVGVRSLNRRARKILEASEKIAWDAGMHVKKLTVIMQDEDGIAYERAVLDEADSDDEMFDATENVSQSENFFHGIFYLSFSSIFRLFRRILALLMHSWPKIEH